MPLSQLAMDDSSPSVVHYGMHVPAATSTPTGTEVHMHSSQQADSYQQIIPGIPQGSFDRCFLLLRVQQQLLNGSRFLYALYIGSVGWVA